MTATNETILFLKAKKPGIGDRMGDMFGDNPKADIPILHHGHATKTGTYVAPFVERHKVLLEQPAPVAPPSPPVEVAPVEVAPPVPPAPSVRILNDDQMGWLVNWRTQGTMKGPMNDRMQALWDQAGEAQRLIVDEAAGLAAPPVKVAAPPVPGDPWSPRPFTGSDGTTGMEFMVPMPLMQGLKNRLNDYIKRSRKLAGAAPRLDLVGEPVMRRLHSSASNYDGEVFDADMTVPVQTVRLVSTPIRIPGWTTIGALDFKNGTPGHPIVMDLAGKVPVEYRNSKGTCDHCGTQRRRNMTFILRDPDGNLKQIGKDCLKDYTGHDPADLVGQFNAMQWIFEIAASMASAGDMSDWDPDMAGAGREDPAGIFTPQSWLQRSAYMIRRFGFHKSGSEEGSTWQDVLDSGFEREAQDEYREHVTVGDKETGEAVRDWLLSIPDDDPSNFLVNAKAALVAEGMNRRTGAILSAAVWVWKRDQEKKAEEAALSDQGPEFKPKPADERTHVGTIGKRQDFTVKLIGFHEYQRTPYGYGDSEVGYLYRFVTEDGNLLMWFGSASAFPSGVTNPVTLSEQWLPIPIGHVLKIRGTPKKHDKDKKDGGPVTIINRVVPDFKSFSADALEAAQREYNGELLNKAIPQVVLFLKARRRDADGTADLFGDSPMVPMPVNVKAYTRMDGTQVHAHTEIRKVRADDMGSLRASPAPTEPGPGPKPVALSAEPQLIDPDAMTWKQVDDFVTNDNKTWAKIMPSHPETNMFELFDHGLDHEADTWRKEDVVRAMNEVWCYGRDATARRAKAALLAANGGKILGIEAKHKTDDRWIAIVPDASEPGRYRYSQFDKRGFYSHVPFDTPEQALDDAVSQDYTIPANGTMDRLSGTQEWADGLKQLEAVQRMSAEEDARVKAAREAKAAKPMAANTAIQIAADSIEKLRGVDVERVLDQGVRTAGQRRALADYIKVNRPDLAGKVDEALQFLGKSVSLLKAMPGAKRRGKVCMTRAEFDAEHARLLRVLHSPDHNDDLDEAEEQEQEVAKMRKSMPVLFLKAKRPHASEVMSDLFDMPILHQGHTTQAGTYVAPFVERHKVLADTAAPTPPDTAAPTQEPATAPHQTTAAPTEYRYALVNRPPGLGAVPKGAVRVDPRPKEGEPHYDHARHGIIVYDHPLTPKEIAAYELAPILTDSEADNLADEVALSYKSHAEKAVELAKEDPDFWKHAVFDAVERVSKEHGGTPSIADWDRLVNRALASLQQIADHEAAPSTTPAEAPSAEPAEAPTPAPEITYNNIKEFLTNDPDDATLDRISKQFGIGNGASGGLVNHEIVRVGSLMGYKGYSKLVAEMDKAKADNAFRATVDFVKAKMTADKAKAKGKRDTKQSVQNAIRIAEARRDRGEELDDVDREILGRVASSRQELAEAKEHDETARLMLATWKGERARGELGGIDSLAAGGRGPKAHQQWAIDARFRAKQAIEKIATVVSRQRKEPMAKSAPVLFFKAIANNPGLALEEVTRCAASPAVQGGEG